MEPSKNWFEKHIRAVVLSIGLLAVAYAAWGVLVTNSRYPNATWINVANWPDATVPLPVSGSTSGGTNVNANITAFPSGSTNAGGALIVSNASSATVSVSQNGNWFALPNIHTAVLQFGVATNSDGTTNGNALCAFQTIVNNSGITNYLTGASYWCNTNCPGIPDIIVGFYGTNQPTALGANGAPAMTYADATNWQGHIEFFNFLGISSSTRTNMRCTLGTVPAIPILPGTNWLLLTANANWTNNVGSPKDTLILNWQ